MRIFTLMAVAVCFSNPTFVLAQQAPAAPPAQADSTRTRAVKEWVASYAIPLQSVEAGAGFDDLKPLESIFKNVRVVGLGEASHGTREFFQFKHRMLEFLVTRIGFTAFSLEASYPACMNINDYVVYGKGDPRKALASQGFSVFDTQEFLALMEWMRQYNSRLPEAKRIKFLGYDMQGQYQYAVAAISAYLKKVAPVHVTEAEAAFMPLKQERGKPLPIAVQSAEEQAKSLARLDNLYSFLLTNRGKFVRQTSEWDFNVVLLHARVLGQGARFMIAMSEASKKAQSDKGVKDIRTLPEYAQAAALRDLYMAENIETQLGMLGSRARMVVSGHNAHVQVGSWGEGIPGVGSSRIPAMGSALRKTYGDAYYALGFDFDRGSFQASARDEKGSWGMQEFPMPPAPEGSLAWYLKTAAQAKGCQSYFIDLRVAPKTGPVAEWLFTPLRMTLLTGGFSKDRKREDSQATVSLRNYFDGLLFVEETTRARSNASSAGK